jgi:hypothetical protein
MGYLMCRLDEYDMLDFYVFVALNVRRVYIMRFLLFLLPVFEHAIIHINKNGLLLCT